MNRWQRIGQQRKLDEQLDKELRFHVEEHTAELMARGVPAGEAHRQALLAFGGLEQIKESCRDVRGTRWLQDLWQDVRYALRMFAKYPGATAVALVSLALAIGPSATLFSVVDRLFLNPVSVEGSSRMFSVYGKSLDGKTPQESYRTPSYPNYLDYRARGQNLGEFLAVKRQNVLLNRNGVNELVSAAMVSDNYFAALQVRPALGRALQESDAKVAGTPPVMLSYSLWQRKFAGARDLLGKTIMLQFRPFYVVGVAPRDFREPVSQLTAPDLWVPLSARSVWDPTDRGGLMKRSVQSVNVTLRLRQGVSLEQAETALERVAAQLEKEYPATNKGLSISLIAVNESGRKVFGAIVLSLFGLVLLIACANVAGILLGQGEARRREFAVRLALGASRRRLLRQLLSETLLLALLSAGMGLLLAEWLMRAIPALLPRLPLPLNFDLRVDTRVLAYVTVISVITTVAAGLLPAVRVSRPNLGPILKGDSPGGKPRSRFRNALIVAQIACSEFLLVGTGLLVASYVQVQNIRPGFDPHRRVLFALLIPNAERPNLHYQDVIEKLRAVPGVRRATCVQNAPLSGSGMALHEVSIAGVTSQSVKMLANAAGPEYFTAMGSTILRGRDFRASDSRGVAIVNEEMARLYWGTADRAVGRFIQVDGKDREIVGVVETGKYRSLVESPQPMVFLFSPTGEYLVIETAGDLKTTADAVRKTIRQTLPGVSVYSMVTLHEELGLAFFFWRAPIGLFATSALLGIFLSGVGLYGVVSHAVARRSHEIGIRMAMGARPKDVLTMILGQGLLMVAIGTLIGMAGAVAAARVLSALLYGVSPANPLALLEAALAVVAVTFLAIQVPSRRAIQTDPMIVLRSE